MLAKFSTFRSKRTSNSQKEKQQHHERFNSHQFLNRETDTPKSNISHFSSNSFVANKSSHDEYSYTESAISATSNEYSSSSSFKTNSIYDGKESVTPTSTVYEEISVGLSPLLPYDEAEEQFLDDYESYFIHLSVDNVRKDQYPELEWQRIVYLDYATCPLYSRFQVEKHMKFMLEESESFFGSRFPIDKQSAEHNPYITTTYKHVLNLLNTTQDEYSVIFTSGLSSCYQLFSEIYPFQNGGSLLASHDHHTSIRHIINTVWQSNVKIVTIPLKRKDLCINGDDMHGLLRKNGCGLLVYSAQSCLTGISHSLNWIASAQQNKWKVLLDVSSCGPNVNVDISLYQPEFVIGSLHHMIGYPSDVGFILVKKGSHSIRTKRGSRELKLVEVPENGKDVHVVSDGERLSVHTFAAMRFGLEHFEEIGVVAIQRRVESLIAWLIKTLSKLKHKSNGKPLLQIYGSQDPKQRGSILAFNVLDPTGNIFPARLVRQIAERSNIFFDSGCLCNSHLLKVKSHKHTETGSTSQFAVQVIRVSLGSVSTFHDVYSLVRFLARFRDEDYMSHEAAGYAEELENDLE